MIGLKSLGWGKITPSYDKNLMNNTEDEVKLPHPIPLKARIGER